MTVCSTAETIQLDCSRNLLSIALERNQGKTRYETDCRKQTEAKRERSQQEEATPNEKKGSVNAADEERSEESRMTGVPQSIATKSKLAKI